MVPTVEWKEGVVRILDQSQLPDKVEFVDCRDYETVGLAIKELWVRGAPAIGIAAAMGVALGAQAVKAADYDTFRKAVWAIGDHLAATRPTAVNLFWAIDRMKRRLDALKTEPIPVIKQKLIDEAQAILAEDIAMNRAIGKHGAAVIGDGQTILTHCNAGALATGGYGTALGVIRTAHADGRVQRVYVDETRPLLQGSRLTAWELERDGIACAVIVDSAAGSYMRRGEIDAVITGADRITANGDVANKIGTYSLAVLAHENKIPFYVAAPTSTVDLSLSSGEDIPIEQRSPDELTHLGSRRLIPERKGVVADNPAFDVTPNRYVTAIITENGVARPPYIESLQGVCTREVPVRG